MAVTAWADVEAVRSWVAMMSITESRRRLLVVCAHEPDEDPRIDWICSNAAKENEVQVVSFFHVNYQRSEKEDRPGYVIHRVNRVFSFLPSGFVRFPMDLVQARGGLPRWAYPLAALLAPVLVAGEIVARFFILVSRLLRPLFPRTSARVLRGVARQRMPQAVTFLETLRYLFGAASALYQGGLKLPGTFEVLHANDLDALLGAVMLKSVGKARRLVYDSHEFWPYSNPAAADYHIAFLRWYEKRLLNYVDAHVTVSEPLAEAMEEAYGVRGIRTVPNAELWRGRPEPPKGAMTELAQDRVKVLFHGNFAPFRGLEEVIEAWQGVDGSKVALFLRGHPSPDRDTLMDLARRRGVLGRSLYFIDPVDVYDLVSAASEADIGLIPYKIDSPAYRYACPNKLSQYLHAGLAVLSNNLPYVEQIVRGGDCGEIYDVRDPNTIVGCVETLIGDREALAHRKENALLLAERDFNWQVKGQVFLDLYRQLGETAHG